MQILLEQREQLAREIEDKKQQLAGMDRAIAILKGSNETAKVSRDTARPAVKGTIMEVVTSHRKEGVTTHEVVAFAAALGKTLDRGSVSSLLSRLKREGSLTIEGGRYFLKEDHPTPKEPESKVVRMIS